MPAPKKAAASGPLSIQRIKQDRLIVPIVGTTPLISHRFDEKARKKILQKQTGNAQLQEARDPVAEYEASLYRIHKEQPARRGKAAAVDDDAVAYGFPAAAFRKATIGAARFCDKSITMTGLRQMFMVKGIITKADPLSLVEIHGEPEMREDHVTLPSGAGLAFRAMFVEWSAELDITYVASSISAESLLSLIDAGGQFVGVGDWRPERTGEFGTYEINGDVKQVKTAAAAPRIVPE